MVVESLHMAVQSADERGVIKKQRTALQALRGDRAHVAWERDDKEAWRWQSLERLEAGQVSAPVQALRCEREGLFGVRVLRRICALRSLRELVLGDFWDSSRRFDRLDLLSALPRLEALDLGSARSEGESGVRDTNLRELGQVASLRTLLLHRSRQITDAGLEQLAPLSGLCRLDLHKCGKISGSGLHGLTGLRELVATSCPVNAHGLQRMARLATLERLDLGSCALDGEALGCLAGLQRLERLSLQDCKSVRDKHLEHLLFVVTLRRLDLSRNGLSDEALEVLGRMTWLTDLRVNADKNNGWINERITDDGLRALRRMGELQRLELEAGTKITDAGLEHLAGLRSLRQLSLDYTGVTAEGVARLQASLPQTKIRWGSTIEEISDALGRYFGD